MRLLNCNITLLFTEQLIFVCVTEGERLSQCHANQEKGIR